MYALTLTAELNGYVTPPAPLVIARRLYLTKSTDDKPQQSDQLETEGH